MPFTESLLSSRKTSLAQSLGDSASLFFTSAELSQAIFEGMTVFQFFSNYYKETATFSPPINERWNVLSSTSTNLINSAGERVLQSQYSDRGTLTTVLNALIETAPLTNAEWQTSTWNLTDQFSKSQIIAALNRTYHRFYSN